MGRDRENWPSIGKVPPTPKLILLYFNQVFPIFRRTLFHSSALMVHRKGQGESAFDWRSKVPASQRKEMMDVNDNDDEKEENCEVSLFVEPIEWMKGQIETVEGKVRAATLIHS